jgi:hypothetical protein
MLSSIHPLGERARKNRWWLTVTGFTLGAMAAGAGTGAALGIAGDVLFGPWVDATQITWISAVLLAAGSLDIVGLKPPGPARQVNEHWIGHYRGWVYGAAFGAQLGSGVSTYVVSWAVYATLAAEFLMGSMMAGAFVGLIFGFGRSLALFLTVTIDRPSRLTAFHRRMARIAPKLTRSSAWAIACLGMVAVLGLLS